MINLDERFLSYLHSDDKMFYIDGKRETVRGYGFQSSDGKEIDEYYVHTDTYRLVYDIHSENCKYMEKQ